MGERIISSLSAVSSSRGTKPAEQPNQSDRLETLCGDTHTVSFVDDIAIEIITVTDYAEVELGTSPDDEVVMGQKSYEDIGTSILVKDSLVVLPDETPREDEVEDKTKEEDTEEKDASGLTNVVIPEENKDDLLSSENKISMGPHDCHNCRKKFKFASSLIAHRVIHTGERPHCCNECGCCFSFRQSLDRHRHTHKTGRKYKCVICGDTFHSLSARTAHKQIHMEDGAYKCHQCSKKFKWELTLARHMKTHTEEDNPNNPRESHKDGQEVLGEESFSEPPAALSQPYKQVLADDSGESLDNAERQMKECPSSQPDIIVPVLDKIEISPVKVRTSGRKRKPTMKIQVINLEKHMASQRRKTMIKSSPPELKHLPLNW